MQYTKRRKIIAHKWRLLAILFAFIFAGSVTSTLQASADANKFRIQNVNLTGQSSATSGSISSPNDSQLESNVVFHHLNDFATYSITLKNTDSKAHTIDSITDNNESEYIAYSYDSHEGETIEAGADFELIVTVSYANAVMNMSERTQDSTVNIFIRYDSNEEPDVIPIIPNTLDGIPGYFIIALVSALGLAICIIAKNKSHKKLAKVSVMAIVAVLGIALAASAGAASTAIDDISLNYNYGLYDRLVVTYTDENGSEHQEIVNYGETVELPELNKAGYDFTGWIYADGTAYQDNNKINEDKAVFPVLIPHHYTISFDANGGTGAMPDQEMTYDETSPLTANGFTRDDSSFDSWNTEADGSGTNYQDKAEVSNLATEGNVTLYAQWNEAFPTVWSQSGNCVFNGPTANITGSQCADYSNVKYIDTGIALYSEENVGKDFEVYFEIVHFDTEEQDGNNDDQGKQASIFSAKVSTQHPVSEGAAASPGIVVRKSSTNIDLRSCSRGNKEQGEGCAEANVAYNAGVVESYKLVRKDGILYYDLNHGGLHVLQDQSNFDQFFNQTAWFGAYPADGTESPAAKRIIIGELKNMYIKLGEKIDWDNYEIKFAPNGGSLDAKQQTALVKKGESVDFLPTPTRNNYIFLGWFTAKTGGNQIQPQEFVPESDQTVYAHWAKSIGAATIQNSEITLNQGENEAIIITNASEIGENYSFSSGNNSIATVDSAGEVHAAGVGETTITILGETSGKTKTVSVTVRQPMTTVYFDDQNGNIQPVSIRTGDALGSNVQDVEREHYFFKGWFTAQTGGQEVTSETTATDGATYYARWTKTIYHLNVPSSVEIARTESFTLELSNQTEIDEQINFSSTDSAVAIYENGKIKAPKTGSCDIVLTGASSGEQKTIHVTVTPRNVTLTLDARDGNNPQEIEYVEGSAISTLPNPTRTNFAFRGWWTEINGGTQLTAGYQINDDEVYYAHWAYGISLITIAPESLSLTKNDTATFTITADGAIENYTVSSDNENIATVNGSTVTGVEIGETDLTITGEETGATRKIHVIVTARQYTVNFDARQGSTVNPITVAEGGNINPLPQSTREHYILDGWFTSTTGGDKLTTTTAITEDNQTYYAHWIADINTATITPDSLTITAGDESTLTVTNNETMEEYTLSVEDENVATIDADGTIHAVAAGQTTIKATGNRSGAVRSIDITVEPIIYTITFDQNDEEHSTDVEYEDGAALGELPAPANRGDDYNFDGWFTAKTGGTQISETTTVTESTTYYAHWTYMPIAWEQLGACTFAPAVDSSLGRTVGHVSGAECAEYEGQEYINTGISLYNTANIDKDYEIYFEIESYNASAQVGYNSDDQKQQTFVNAKDPVGNANGLIIRRSGTNIEVNSKAAKVQPTAPTKPGSQVRSIRVRRKNGVIYYSFNGEEERSLQDISNSETFPLATWFGAYPSKGSYTTPQTTYDAKRFITATLKNMYIRLERAEPKSSDEIVEHYAPSAAAQSYFANIANWKDDETALLTGLQANYLANSCKDTSPTDVSNHAGFQPYKYTSTTNGANCDQPNEYDTGANGDIIVRLSDETKTKGGKIVNYLTTDGGVINNMIPDEIYYWESASNPDIYGYVKAEGERRFIKLGGTTRNVRDLGGLTADGGRKIKYGKIFRGENIKTETDKDTLLRLGVTKEYELRKGDGDSNNGPIQLDNRAKAGFIHYDMIPTENFTNYEEARNVVTQAMQDLIAGESIYAHCTHGADRTGTLAYILEGLLGVSQEDRYEDYELTTLAGQSDRTRYYRQKNTSNNGSYIYNRKFVYMTGFIGTNQEIYDWYTYGLSDTTAADQLIEDFRNAVLE